MLLPARTTPRRLLGGLAATTAAALITGLTVAPAGAHGYIDGEVRARAATSQNTARGPVQWEPQSLEAPKGFPGYGPADGTIASAGGIFRAMDAQSSTRWHKWPITTGPMTLRWKFTAPHRTAKFHYYMTKQGWDQNAPLSRSSLERIATVPHDGTPASTNPAHEVVIPADRSGYHVILAVWDIYDTGNAFYNVVDVDVTPGAGETGTGETGSETGSETGTETGSETGTETGTETGSGTGTETGTETGTGTGSETGTETGTETGSETGTGETGSGETGSGSGTETGSETGTGETGSGETGSGSGTETGSETGAAQAWHPFRAYSVGDRVTHQGRTYVAIQSYQGWGDPNWIYAPSLWTPLP